MSMERSFEAWEEVQRHGQDLADRFAQGFTGLIQSHISPPQFAWPNTPVKPKFFDFDVEFPYHINNTSTFNLNPVGILDIGSRIGQAGAEFGGFLNGVVQQLVRRLPVPFKHEEEMEQSGVGPVAGFGVQREGNLSVKKERRSEVGVRLHEELDKWRDFGFTENEAAYGGLVSVDDDTGGSGLRSAGFSGRQHGVINITSTYDSRTHEIGSSLVARGDLWRVETSNGGPTSGNENSSLFLVQLGPVLFVRDSTLLLPLHLSKQHLLWYGYDRKNGMHSLCPAVWSKHRRWLLMSMLCLNPVACSFVDLQFPNGQFTYVSGEGLTMSAFLPLCGGLLQAQGQYPGEMRFSFSCKSKWGTRITPMVQLPDKSLTMGLAQALVWRRSGLMVKPTIQFSLCPTFGGSNPGVQAEVIHTVNERMSLNCGCAYMTHPSAFASISLGRSKSNGSLGSSGIVLRADTPLSRVGRPSLSVRLNSVIEF
ncbi:hypothetical protein CFOL_v3_04221 [Cephalotus follicularis]|uniref:Uncharacterized protein n=1 Tax=Cephalotus follicularis TaxID=3775 RepID=A0A1Q3AYQ1_CEPFO|nr:hypothetical protein CFOL_v3_04221 [Cephalotus follicularis]